MKFFLVVLSIIIILGLCGSYIGLRIWFKSDINKIRNSAQSKFEGDKIEALISVLNSDSEKLKNKNQAIWALGKLNDERAMPTLKNLQTNSECNHSRFVCQRELEKAINNLEGNSIDLLTFK